MKLAESCVIEQHIERLFKGVEPTNLGLGTPDAALIVRNCTRLGERHGGGTQGGTRC